MVRPFVTEQMGDSAGAGPDFVLSTQTAALSSPDTRRILVVDDNESIRAFLRHFFKLEHLAAEIIESPHLAWERFQAAPADYCLLLTDCEMPGMTGVELAQRIRQQRADLPMILFSTSVAVHGPEHFATQGFVHALPKPAPLDQLRAAVRDALGQTPSAGI
jgi:CheY-like chemotaxis protein